ncbi:hypothetical protein BJF77_17465 [Kocuria sp. CNJ-770]|uniref:restriction endonuclease n=1 Tax=Kocuria sp. CNJ-770 TaxID=1904964 RepID=UPI0009660FD2|nr:restriction endonuclease [Kocuria sp. CNJ-770]OLT04002.1 hypothetical protein BJF77_17465 [Kocuria sp. CNJ-770]
MPLKDHSHEVAFETTRYPPADMSPADFERFVVETLRSINQDVDDLKVTLHELVKTSDGTYDMDATMRFRLGGMDFLVLVEAKKHTHLIKREIPQILHQKVQSSGAQKGLIVSTTPFQRGALDFAKTHGIALVTVTEGRFIFETRSAMPRPLMTSQEAIERYDLPTFIAQAYRPTPEGKGTRVTLLDQRDPEHLVEVLTDVSTRI